MASLSQLLKGRLKPVVEKVWNTASYRDAAKRLQNAVSYAGGAERGADILQQVLRTGRPVVGLTAEAAK